MNKGYESLKASVEHDCSYRDSCDCFNPNGCDKEFSSIGEYGVEGFRRCSHPYCDKFKWVVERSKHYGEKLGLRWEDVLASWENDRGYWYMNYYQDCKQPMITSETVKVFETVEDMRTSVGEQGFRCPACDGVSKSPCKCDSGLSKGGKLCDWKAYGLFGTLGKGVFVYCKDKLAGQTIFMPVAWEQAQTEGFGA